MFKQVKLTVKFQCKVEQRTYDMLDGERSESIFWKTESFQVLAYCDHKIECATNTMSRQLGELEFEFEPTAIRYQALFASNSGTTVHEITCDLPIIYVPAKSIGDLEHGLDLAIKRVAQVHYVDGDYTAIEAVQLALEKEINDLFSDFWKQEVAVIRADTPNSEWLAIRLLCNSSDPLIAFWLPDNSIVVD